MSHTLNSPARGMLVGLHRGQRVQQVLYCKAQQAISWWATACTAETPPLGTAKAEHPCCPCRHCPAQPKAGAVQVQRPFEVLLRMPDCSRRARPPQSRQQLFASPSKSVCMSHRSQWCARCTPQQEPAAACAHLVALLSLALLLLYLIGVVHGPPAAVQCLNTVHDFSEELNILQAPKTVCLGLAALVVPSE